MAVLEDNITKFLAVGIGYGNGDGSGYGSGDGSGDGSGYGSGYGYGYGCGYGYGDDYNKGISEIQGKRVYQIDDIPTIIENIHDNIAKCYILRHNVILDPCYVAKVENFFAHGETAHEAMAAAQEKFEESKPLEERIADTIKKYPTLDTKVSHAELYTLHHVLTGSCKFGRDAFAEAHHLDPEKGSMTIQEFIDLTRKAYNGSAIHKLETAYKLIQAC